MNSYELKQEAKRLRLEARAEKLKSASDAAYKSARSKAEMIPFGQPILVGHYSEKRDRNFRAKIENGFRKSFELQKAAGEVAARAASIGTGGISSDDPEAVQKLKAELAEVEAEQTFMVAANKVIKAFYKAGVRDEAAGEAWERYLGKLREVKPGIGPVTAKKLLEPDFCGRIGFPGYAISNNGANARRIKQRIEQLGKASEREHKEIECAGGIKLVQNVEANRVQIIFPGVPPAETRTLLKSRGFRWSPSEGAWQRHLNNSGIYAAQDIVRQLTAGAK